MLYKQRIIIVTSNRITEQTSYTIIIAIPLPGSWQVDSQDYARVREYMHVS